MADRFQDSNLLGNDYPRPQLPLTTQLVNNGCTIAGCLVDPLRQTSDRLAYSKLLWFFLHRPCISSVLHQPMDEPQIPILVFLLDIYPLGLVAET